MDIIEKVEVILSNEFVRKGGVVQEFRSLWNGVDKSDEKYEEIYKNLKDVIISHLQKVRVNCLDQGDDRSFFGFVIESWNNFQMHLSSINELLRPLDEEYLRSFSLSSYQVGVDLFSKVFLLSQKQDPSFTRVNLEKSSTEKSILGRIVRTILSAIKKERIRETIHGVPKFVMKNVIRMLYEISLKEIYSQFEEQLLKETEEFYRNEAKVVLGESMYGTVYFDTYLRRVGEERDISRRYVFYRTTFSEIEKILLREFFELHPQSLTFEDNKNGINCYAMLEEWNLEGLRKLYVVMSRISGAHDKLKVVLQKYLERVVVIPVTESSSYIYRRVSVHDMIEKVESVLH